MPSANSVDDCRTVTLGTMGLPLNVPRAKGITQLGNESWIAKAARIGYDNGRLTGPKYSLLSDNAPIPPTGFCLSLFVSRQRRVLHYWLMPSDIVS